MYKHPDYIVVAVAKKIQQHFNNLEDLPPELANTIVNHYAVLAYAANELELIKYMDNLAELYKNNTINYLQAIDHVKTCISIMPKLIQDLRNISKIQTPKLRNYTEQLLVDLIKYGMNTQGIGAIGLIRRVKRLYAHPILYEEINLYEQVKKYYT